MTKLTSARLENRIVLITGAGRGIGQAIAIRFAQESADVIIADIDPVGAQETASTIKELDQECLVLEVDVSKSDDVQKMTNKVYETFNRVDILVNNAGIIQAGDPLVKLPEALFDKVVAINLRGTYLCSKYVGQKMLRQKKMLGSKLRGKIINLSSMAGKEGYAFSSVYCATKFGIIGLTQAMAKEVAPRITVNAICPGIIKTSLWGPLEERLSEIPSTMNINIYMKRTGTPEDITPMAIFLASPDSDYIT
ncbi:MAG: SDR family oxidoreductase, partial [Candidatus Helarchaeota archaeon]|nr:SDR family oxidoreductase [Candidatus Helarchaeota archaeon]